VLGRSVVVKRGPAGGEGSGLEAEARAIARLDHDHVVTLYTTDVVDDERVLVLEHCAGGTLGTRSTRPRCPATRCNRSPTPSLAPCRRCTRRAWCTGT